MQCIGPSFDGFAYLPALDTRGGILLGWSSAHLSISNITFDTNFLSGLVHSQDGSEWWLSAVYGPQGDELKTQFLVELQHRRDVSPRPWMVLGDFNMIIRANEKSNSNLNRGMMRKFKAFVDNNELKELYMHGRRFTWSNERDQLVMTKIDRVLVSVDWELNFPDVLLQALSSNISDHAPLHLSTSAPFCPKRRFRFETCWTRLEGFEQAVKDAWVCEDDTVDPFKRLNALLRNTASALQAWGQCKIGNIKIQMAIANFVILRLDRAMESRQLDCRERWLRRSLKHALLGLASLQRTIERQRSRLRWIREGDANTKLFQAVANGRRTKNFIPHIRHNGELVSQQERKEEIFSDAYKQLLGQASARDVNVDLGFLDMAHLNLSELDDIFTEEEVWSAIKEMHLERAPGPDGFTAAFYQKAWPIIKHEIMAVFLKLYVGDGRGFGKLNRAHIVLIPKKPTWRRLEIFGQLASLIVWLRFSPSYSR
ncbi:uncharacterized protein [Aegilops tauschii subsp. strangulata]|uniref:uncharacterized protein n=1 Tax=Aegilops tauschii subsp. strangulata TaxID=200361 RepID=UPI003CC86300